jgi:hypothetical protein
MRHAVLSLAAALAAVLALSAPAASQAGDRWGDGWGGDGAWTEVHRDGNVFYNAYNSQDGYYRDRVYGGYWSRPGDEEGYGCGECDGYGYDQGYGYAGGYRDGWSGDGRRIFYPGYGYVDASRREIRRTEKRLHCEDEGGREYHGRCY